MKKAYQVVISVIVIFILSASIYATNSFSNNKEQVKRAVENHLYNIRHYKQKAIKKIEVHYAMFGFHAIVIFHDEKDVAYTYMYKSENKRVYQHSFNKLNGDAISSIMAKHSEEKES